MKMRKDKVKGWGLLLGIITLCFTIFIMVLQGIDQFKQAVLDKKIEEVNYLTHLLIKQEADVFSALIFHNVKEEELQEKLDKFAKEDIVLNATLYAANGNLLVVSKKNNEISKNNVQIQDIVEPIYYKDNLEGFLRITLSHSYLPEIHKALDKMFIRLYAHEIILFLVGGILMLSLYSFMSINLRHSRTKEISLFNVELSKDELNKQDLKKQKIDSVKNNKDRKKSRRKKKQKVK